MFSAAKYFLLSQLCVWCLALQSDQIKDLPGLRYKPSFSQFSGYLNATGDFYDGRHLFYWLTEVQDANPDKKPLVLWLNGGPSCSSIGGLLNELGPFRANPGGDSLFEHVYAWNKAANFLFLESPAGVGFSYTDSGNITVNDDEVADQNFYALLSFVAKFPQYEGRDFFITGESYAGVYIPTLVKVIMERNDSFPMNLKGFAIGNGILSSKHQTNSVLQLLYYRGVMGFEERDKVNEKCCGKPDQSCNWYEFLQFQQRGQIFHSDGSECGDLVEKYVVKTVEQTTDNQYNYYQDCYKPGETQKQVNQKSLGRNLAELSTEYKINYDSTDELSGIPCFQSDANAKYLHRDDVRKALHVVDKSQKWIECNMHMYNDTYTRYYFEMMDTFVWILKTMKDNPLRILIYNGDVDSVCNFLGDEWFVRDLSNNLPSILPQKEDRKPWHHRGVIAGHYRNFGPLTQLTVKGAGHFVPLSRPGPSLQMIKNFIDNVDYSAELDVSVKLVDTTIHRRPSGGSRVAVTMLPVMNIICLFVLLWKP